MTKVNYHWNDETITHFTFMSNYISRSEVKREIYEFVVNNCELEDDETYEDLSESLCRQVF